MTLQDLQKLSNGTPIQQLRGTIQELQAPGMVQMPEGRMVKAQRATLRLDDNSTINLDIYGEQHVLPRDALNKRYAFVSSGGKGVSKNVYTPRGLAEPVTVVRISTGCVASQIIEPKQRPLPATNTMKENPIAPIRRLWVACAKEAKLAAQEASIELQSSELQALATTFFIESNKKGIAPPPATTNNEEPATIVREDGSSLPVIAKMQSETAEFQAAKAKASQPREPEPKKPEPETRDIENEFDTAYDKLATELGSKNVHAAYDVFLDRYKAKCQELGADINLRNFQEAMLDVRWNDLVERAKEFQKLELAKEASDEIPITF